MRNLLTNLNGAQTLGESKVFWGFFALLVIGLFLLPLVASDFTVFNLSYFFSQIFMALGLCLIWGYTDILSFGQVAFFGLGGYAYGVLGINLLQSTGHTNLALLGGILIPALFAFVLGYFMFYGKISGVFVTIITVVVPLILETYFGQTAGDKYRIGEAFLGGYNGMTNIPPPKLGFGSFGIELFGDSFYYFVLVLLVLIYLTLRTVVNSKFGYSLVAIRENPERTEMFGYDIRKVQLVIFTVAAGLAGLSGTLYAGWGNYITPSSMDMTNAALPVIWVAVGGRKSLTATIISAFAIQYFSQYLSITGSEYALVILGALLLVVMLFLPDGVIPPLVTRARILCNGFKRKLPSE